MFSAPLSTLATSVNHSAEAEANIRRQRKETYTEPLRPKGKKFSKEEMEDFKEFMMNFYKTIYKRRDECSQLCAEYPDTIGKYCKELVPKQISYEEFWQRYFYRCDVDNINNEWNRRTLEETSELEQQLVSSVTDSVQGVTNFIKSAVGGLQEDADTNKMAASSKEAEIEENKADAPIKQDAALERTKTVSEEEILFSSPGEKDAYSTSVGSNEEQFHDPLFSGISLKKTAANSEVSLRRSRKATYLEPIQRDDKLYTNEQLTEMNEFVIHFHETFQTRSEEFHLILQKHPRTVGHFYGELVPDHMTPDEFWLRYFYRCDADRIALEWERQQTARKEQLLAHKDQLNQSLRKSVSGATQLFKSALTFGGSQKKDDTTNGKQPPQND